METQLQTLIDKIKSDGIGEAEKKSREILEKAERTAARIMEDAKQAAETLIHKAREEATRERASGEMALQQAGRNLVLGLRKSLTDVLSAAITAETSAALSPQTLAAMLEKLAANWKSESAGKGLEVFLSPKDMEALQKGFLASLAQKIKGGITLTPVPTIDAGFQVGEKGGQMVYDFTDKGISEIISQCVNPKIGDLLKKA